MGATIELRRVSAALRDDFYRVHDATAECGWCACVFWWVPTNDGWGERRAEENRSLRDDLFARGVRRIEAFPRPGRGLPPDEAWTGPEALFTATGFRFVRDTGRRSVYALDLASDPRRDVRGNLNSDLRGDVRGTGAPPS